MNSGNHHPWVRNLTAPLAAVTHVHKAAPIDRSLHVALPLPAVASYSPAVAHLLLVDDDSELLSMAATALVRSGHKVTTAISPVEAARHLPSSEFDLILMDIDMPGMDGLSFARLLQENPHYLAFRDVPIVIISGSSRPGIFADSLEANAVFFLAKPFSLEDLSRTVRLVLGESPRPYDPDTEGPPA